MVVEFSRPDRSKPTVQDLKDEPALAYVLRGYFARLNNLDRSAVHIENLGVELQDVDFRLTVDWGLVQDPVNGADIVTDVDAIILMRNRNQENPDPRGLFPLLCDETISVESDRGRSYRGCQSRTKSGIDCVVVIAVVVVVVSEYIDKSVRAVLSTNAVEDITVEFNHGICVGGHHN